MLQELEENWKVRAFEQKTQLGDRTTFDDT